MSGLINFCGLNICSVSIPKIDELEKKIDELEEKIEEFKEVPKKEYQVPTIDESNYVGKLEAYILGVDSSNNNSYIINLDDKTNVQAIYFNKDRLEQTAVMYNNIDTQIGNLSDKSLNQVADYLYTGESGVPHLNVNLVLKMTDNNLGYINYGGYVLENGPVSFPNIMINQQSEFSYLNNFKGFAVGSFGPTENYTDDFPELKLTYKLYNFM